MTPQKAKSLLTALEKEGLMSPQGLVRLEASRAEMKTVVQKIFSDSVEEVVTVVSQGRYNNLKRLLGDHFCEETYLKIVENKILVDIQVRRWRCFGSFFSFFLLCSRFFTPSPCPTKNLKVYTNKKIA